MALFGLFGTNDPTLEPEALDQLRTLGYSNDEIRTWTRELREAWLNDIAQNGVPVAPIVDPAQAVTAEQMSLGSQFVRQVKERTAVMLEKLKVGAPVIMVLGLAIAGVALFLRVRGK